MNSVVGPVPAGVRSICRSRTGQSTALTTATLPVRPLWDGSRSAGSSRTGFVTALAQTVSDRVRMGVRSLDQPLTGPKTALANEVRSVAPVAVGVGSAGRKERGLPTELVRKVPKNGVRTARQVWEGFSTEPFTTAISQLRTHTTLAVTCGMGNKESL
jgi:hypothetical protein